MRVTLAVSACGSCICRITLLCKAAVPNAKLGMLSRVFLWLFAAEQSSSSGVLLSDALHLRDGGEAVAVVFGCETQVLLRQTERSS